MLNDFAFQWIFGRKGHERITISLINSVLQLENERQIEALRYLNPFNLRRFFDEKLTIVDVKARDRMGRWYNIEAQACQHSSYVPRTVLYVARLYADQAHAGDNYATLSSATSISIMNFDLFPESKRVHEAFEFCNRGSSIILKDTLALHYIDLTKFRDTKPRKDMTRLEKWLHVMKFSADYGKMETEIPECIQNEENIVMAISELKRINANERMRVLMEAREKDKFVYNLELNARFQDGIEIGKEEGKAEGKAEGKEESRAEIAARMIRLGIDNETIIQATGLSEAELQKIVADQEPS
jgi:predicted transposase/invertase (TIGR01784 family)